MSIPENMALLEYNDVEQAAKRDQINNAPRRTDSSFATLRLCASSFFWEIMVDLVWILSSRSQVEERPHAKAQRRKESFLWPCFCRQKFLPDLPQWIGYVTIKYG
jgi:hypothetical protein